MDIIDTIIQEVEAFNESIRETLAAKRINNTKEASDSIRIEIEKNQEKIHCSKCRCILFGIS